MATNEKDKHSIFYNINIFMLHIKLFKKRTADTATGFFTIGTFGR